MRIGLTFDLRADYLALGYGEEETAEFDSIATIDALAGELVRLGHDVDRVGNVHRLVQRLAAGDRWHLVFNIAEGLGGVSREAQVPALLDVFEIPYTFCDPLVASLTLHKGMTKRVLRDLGLPTTDFAVIESLEQLDAVALPWPLFVKPVAEGTAKGISPTARVTTKEALRERCAEVIERYRQPALVEPYLPGREFTVGLVGTGAAARVLGTLEIELLENADPFAYGYRNKEECESCCAFRLCEAGEATELARIALAAWRGVGCRDAGRVDLRLDAEGRPQILEINPLPGLHPTHSDLPILCSLAGIEYSQLIEWIVASASQRRTRSTHAKLDPAVLSR